MLYENNVIELPVVKVPANGSINVCRTDIAHAGPFDFLFLELQEEQAPHLIVTDVKVGKNSQLYSALCLPASLFARRTDRPYVFAFDRVQPAQAVTVSITNVTDVERQVVVRAVGQLIKTSGPGANAEWYGGPRLGICGLGLTVVPARGVACVEGWSQVRYAPSVLHVPPHLLDQLAITRVTKSSAYVLGPDGRPRANAGLVGPHDEVEESMLTRDNLARNGDIKFKLESVVTLNEKIGVTVQNLTDRDVAFTGALLGVSAGRMDLI
jgi:hypothetical protein